MRDSPMQAPHRHGSGPRAIAGRWAGGRDRDRAPTGAPAPTSVIHHVAVICETWINRWAELTRRGARNSILMMLHPRRHG